MAKGVTKGRDKLMFGFANVEGGEVDAFLGLANLVLQCFVELHGTREYFNLTSIDVNTVTSLVEVCFECCKRGRRRLQWGRSCRRC